MTTTTEVSGTADAAQAGSATRERRTPAGLERRGLKATGIVLGVILFFTAGLSLIDALVPTPGTEVDAGQVVNLGGRARFTPATDWERESKSNPKGGNYFVARAGVEFRIGVFSSDLSATAVVKTFQGELRKTYPTILYNDTTTATTSAGLSGVACQFSALNVKGAILALSRGGSAVLSVAIGPPENVVTLKDQINAMFDSIEFVR